MKKKRAKNQTRKQNNQRRIQKKTCQNKANRQIETTDNTQKFQHISNHKVVRKKTEKPE